METPAIACEGLCKRFRSKAALDHLDLSVPQGTVHGLLGPNGAGKTTAVRVLATLLRPDSAAGTTVLLTTQYLEEADQLAGAVTVIAAGRVIAEGTPDELKAQAGGDRVDVTVRRASDLTPAARLLQSRLSPDVRVDQEGRQLSVPVTDRLGALTQVIESLREANIAVEDITVRRPTLDDAFLHLTGQQTPHGPVSASTELAGEVPAPCLSRPRSR